MGDNSYQQMEISWERSPGIAKVWAFPLPEDDNDRQSDRSRVWEIFHLLSIYQTVSSISTCQCEESENSGMEPCNEQGCSTLSETALALIFLNFQLAETIHEILSGIRKESHINRKLNSPEHW